MPAYVIVDVDIQDPEAYKEYAALAPATIQAYGGKYLARAGRTETLEGEWTPKRLVILEFDRVERAKEWLYSPEYGKVKPMRHEAASTQMVVIEGV